MCELFGKQAVKVEAKPLMWGVTPKAKLYKIGDSDIWIPNSVHQFCPYPASQQRGREFYKDGKMPAEPTGELIIHKWYYDKNIKNECR